MLVLPDRPKEAALNSKDGAQGDDMLLNIYFLFFTLWFRVLVHFRCVVLP